MNILLIEDNLDHAELIIEMLHDAYRSKAKITHFQAFLEGINHLRQHAIDLLLCDLQLPDSPIDDTVLHLEEIKDLPATIVLTSLNDEGLAHQLVKCGIQDYLPKNEISQPHLVRACNYAMERRKLNLSLINKNEDYKAFCYSLTHDFKNSLWQIDRFAKIFTKETKKRYPDAQDMPFEYLEKIFGKLHNILRLVDDLQDYLSLDVSQKNHTEMSLHLPIQNAMVSLTDLIEKKNVKIITEENMPYISTNATQIQLLFANLFSNAIKYNNSDEVRINISYTEDNKDFHIITFSDNGIGIPQESIDTIFIPFERIHAGQTTEGSGLGLSIVKRIMQQHNGRIHVDSELGKGTSFSLYFPKFPPTGE